VLVVPVGADIPVRILRLLQFCSTIPNEELQYMNNDRVTLSSYTGQEGHTEIDFVPLTEHTSNLLLR